jgi:hypothetical protein
MKVGTIPQVLVALMSLGPSTATSAQETATFSSTVKGTVVVVVSTREGFVLAGDSRGTHSDGHYTDDIQKVFPVGNRTACVVAGVIGAEIGMAGFRLRDAIASHLMVLDQRTSTGEPNRNDARTVARAFEHGFGSVVGLLEPGNASLPRIVAATSVVSVGQDGNPQWMTFYLPVETQIDSRGGMYFTTGRPLYLHHSLNMGLRFDIQVLGYPVVAEAMIRADKPSSDEYSKSSIMKTFYKLKKKGQLDRLSIKEAIDLAQTLVSATIANAPQTAGVGGR